jgi:hypothetical protein
VEGEVDGLAGASPLRRHPARDDELVAPQPYHRNGDPDEDEEPDPELLEGARSEDPARQQHRGRGRDHEPASRRRHRR